MLIKRGDDPKTKILRVIEAEEMLDASTEELLKKHKKSDTPTEPKPEAK